MTEPTITCPNCHAEIKLTESLAAPLLEATKREFEQRLSQKDDAIAKREQAIKEREVAVARSQQAIDQQVQEKLKIERTVIAAEEAKKARFAIGSDLERKGKEVEELQQVLKQRDAKLAEAQNAQAELIRKQRELDDAKREMELTIEKRVQGSISKTREQAQKEAEETMRLKMAEKEKVIEDQKRQLAEAQRKLEQGSQQLQGEVQELDLEQALRDAFPRDTIVPVPKGQFGGDAVHRVIGTQGQVCGTILWESKRTKNWTASWPDKLKQDQRAARADLAVIVTQAMPQGLNAFGEVDCVWVTTPALAIPLAAALRLALTEASMARRATEGQQDKMAILYQYLTGPQFRQRIEAIKDAFITMQEDLDAERRAINKQWAKRQQQIDRVMVSTVGMYGDFQAIAGKTLKEIEGLSVASLPMAEDRDNGGSNAR
jgi:hypothetical protein